MSPHPLATLTLTDCVVPDDHLLGEAGAGFALAMRTLDIFRTSVAAAAVGFARRAMTETLAHAQARGMFGAIIVDPKDAKVWPKADREYVLVQSEYFKNPNDVQAMFDRKYDGMMFNGGIFKYHPFVTGGGKLDAKPGERVRIYFVNAGPNEFSSFHPIGEIWDNVYESGNPANNLKGVQTYVVGPGSAATFDVVVESAGAYPLVTHSLTGALRGAIAVLLAGPDAKPAPLMPMVTWELPAK